MIEVLARRAAGLALVALAAFVPVAAFPRLTAWDARLRGGRAPEHTVLDLVIGGGAIWLIIAIGLGWHWRRTTMWPIWARWAAFPGLFLAVVTCFFIASDWNKPVALVIGLGLVVASWLAGEAARLVLTRPVTTRLISSKLEIPFPTRGLKARLCVRADRLVLDSLVSRRKRSRDVLAVPWASLRSIELVEVDVETVWRARVFSNWVVANTREFEVAPGPALHVVGTARELLIPVTPQVGQTVLAAVRARSANVEFVEDPFAKLSWYAAAHVSPERRPKEAFRTDSRPYILGLVGAFLLMPLLMLTGMTLSLVTGSEKMQEQFYAAGGVVHPGTVATLGIASVVFLYLLHRFVIKPFLDGMWTQDYIEAYPAPPPAPVKTGAAPRTGKKRKRR
ncbi:hypothetical protein AB0M48_23645 [Lentzea sp. NPDC051208]|uniref:hypothetical protein n=1 Tax=Lentzea sp. NPDC051208 TaxID=3154642 RepID=UPI00343E54CA